MKYATAILLFTETPFQEAIRKNLGGEKTRTSAVFSVLKQKMAQVAKATGLPVFGYECPHKDDSFGNQLTTAITQIFARNFDKVICIGNDCPAVTTQLLLQTATQLQANCSVLGADQRGGAYLIGLSREGFDSIGFQRLPWLSSRLFGALSVLYENAILLPLLPDIHSAQDLRNYASWQPTLSSFIRLLTQLLQSPNWIFREVVLAYTSLISFFRSLRAPPAYAPFFNN